MSLHSLKVLNTFWRSIQRISHSVSLSALAASGAAPPLGATEPIRGFPEQRFDLAAGDLQAGEIPADDLADLGDGALVPRRALRLGFQTLLADPRG